MSARQHFGRVLPMPLGAALDHAARSAAACGHAFDLFQIVGPGEQGYVVLPEGALPPWPLVWRPGAPGVPPCASVQPGDAQ